MNDAIREWQKQQHFKFKWVRSKSNFQASFKKPKVYMALGIKDSGKSALLELIASQHSKIIDLYGARDNEGLGWLRSPFRKNALLLKGNSVELECDFADVLNASEVTLKDIEKHDLILSCANFYSSSQEEWFNIGKLTKKLWTRTHWNEVWFLILREASNFLYSRIKLGDTQEQAKAHLIYMLREMRHCGFSLGLDALRWKSIDIDIRELTDFTFFKRQGVKGLPKDLKFLYRDFDPAGVRGMAIYRSIILCESGPYGSVITKCPYWHKKEKEDLLNHFNLQPKYKEIPFTAEMKHGSVSDYEHVSIIKHRMESNLSMNKLSKSLNRSSRTIHTHIHMHNNMIHAVGECDKCMRVGSSYAKTILE